MKNYTITDLEEYSKYTIVSKSQFMNYTKNSTTIIYTDPEKLWNRMGQHFATRAAAEIKFLDMQIYALTQKIYSLKVNTLEYVKLRKKIKKLQLKKDSITEENYPEWFL